MLQGRQVRLRPVREADLDALYDAHVDIRNRGAFFPLGIQSKPAFRREFAENGFWQKTEGMLLITTPDGQIAGHIEFFRPVVYWDAFELSYQLYDDRHAGHGYVTDAASTTCSRPKRSTASTWSSCRATAPPVASPRSAASSSRKRHAERSSTTDNHDVLLYSLLRTDPRPWHDADA